MELAILGGVLCLFIIGIVLDGAGPPQPTNSPPDKKIQWWCETCCTGTWEPHADGRCDFCGADLVRD